MDQGVDLSALKNQAVPLVGEQAEMALMDAAMRAGMICSNCGRVISSPGREYVKFGAVEDPQRGPTVKITRIYICWRDECEDARQVLSAECTAERESSAWHVNFDTEPPEAADGDADRG